ncbi:hypothetical protein LTR53_008713 [Teratosphaeriaceae sp. CCFEE 6253]|nr:hypothetical protein LTR53_008713 [Teratosphaeriaceae sp. CCFEE 6253]
MPDISELVTDPAEQLMCRFNLDLLYLKTKLVLHRRYMLTPLSQLSDEEQKLGIGRSRKTCVESGLRVLQHHHTIYTASQPGGQLESVKWYMGSISTHDFLLAAMIICLELSTQLQADQYLLVNPSGHRCPTRGPMIEALEKSQAIWADSTRRKRTNSFNAASENRKSEQMFDETEKAARAMAIMIEKVRAQFGSGLPARSADGMLLPEYWAEADPQGSKKTPGAEARSPFNGVVSTYDWGDMSGVPELAQGDSSAAFLTSDNVAQGTATAHPDDTVTRDNAYDPARKDGGPTHGIDRGPELDFSTIGDMFSFNTTDGAAGNMDWEMWDTQFTAGQQVRGNGEWLGQTTVSQGSSDFQHVMSGNAIMGGSGVVGANGTNAASFHRVWTEGFDGDAMNTAFAAQPAQPGASSQSNQIPVTVPRGPSTVAFGPGIWETGFGDEIDTDSGGGGSGGGPPNVRMGNMEYDMSIPLDDVTFDLGVAEYDRNGMYPATDGNLETAAATVPTPSDAQQLTPPRDTRSLARTTRSASMATKRTLPRLTLSLVLLITAAALPIKSPATEIVSYGNEGAYAAAWSVFLASEMHSSHAEQEDVATDEAFGPALWVTDQIAIASASEAGLTTDRKEAGCRGLTRIVDGSQAVSAPGAVHEHFALTPTRKLDGDMALKAHDAHAPFTRA